MRQHILLTALAAAVSALAHGQNLNPTVEVTNAYEGASSSIVKPAQRMAVPDSVMKFNLDFDYSVSDRPYEGAYEFRPYYVRLKPTPAPSTEERFYLRLGAGYTLHPELDLVWTPLRKDRFRMNVYATHRSYFGRYHLIDPVSAQDGVWLLRPTGEKMDGFLSDTKAGVDGTFFWEGGTATLDLAYRHRMAEDQFLFRRMGGVEASASVRSLKSETPHFLYDATVDYHFLAGDQSPLPTFGGAGVDAAASESLFRIDGTFGPVLDADRRILVDLDLDLARYRGYFAGYTGLLSATPKYVFSLDRWHFSLGARLSSIIYSEDFNLWEDAYDHHSGTIFPDVRVDFGLLDDRLILQASATGGDRFASLSGRFLSHPFTTDYLCGHATERIRAMLGARGQIASRFRYDFQGGYARWSHAPLEGFFQSRYAQPSLEEKSYHLVFAQLDYGWKNEFLTVDGLLSYRWTAVGEDVFAPAAFTGYCRPSYNWGERFKAGLDLEWSTSRTAHQAGVDYRVPGWLDLGLHAEYRFTHHFGFWVKAGNLLNQAIQRTPVHAEAGIFGAAGILLNF